MKLSNLVCGAIALLDRCIASPQQSQPAAQRHPVSVIHAFPNDTWVENIAVRENGKLLVTILTAPHLYMIDPFRLNEDAVLVHTFASQTTVVGVAEVGYDTYAVAALNFSVSTGTVEPGSCAVYKVDLSGFRSNPNGTVTSPATVTKIAAFPDAGVLNGMTALNESSQTVLIADSTRGVVYRLDTASGEHSIALSDKTLQPPSSSDKIRKRAASAIPQLGVNGVRTHGNVLYFTNSNKALFVKVPINTDGTAAGKYQIVAKGIGHVDDFTIASNGDAYVTGFNRLQKITPDGQVTLYAGGKQSLTLEGDTSAAFGRTPADCDTIYITTNGGIAMPVDGKVVGGKVLAVQVS